MNYKLDYITRLFQKTSKKAIESYVLSRLWHRLDNDEIKIIPQQYVNRHKHKYALTDVYFPQFKIHVEVNERAHYESEERIQNDKKRKEEIEMQTGHKVYEIDCRKSLKEIHAKVDQIVKVINVSLIEQHRLNTFKPWNPDEERSVEYWRRKNVISGKDEVCLNNIEDICNLFNADFKKTKRGYLRLGGISHPEKNNVILWWPSEKSRKGWLNYLDEENKTITETHSDNNKKEEHYINHLNSQELRYVFYHSKDILGLVSYKFEGVFAYDSERSTPEIGTVWKKIDDRVEL